MGEKDITQKNFEAYNDVAADIINGSLFNGEQIISPDSLIDAQPFSQYKADDSKLHEQERDVSKYCIDKNCNIRLALIGFENQTAIDPDMPLRLYGYDGAAYRNELNQDKIKIDESTGIRHKIRQRRYPVITLVLYFGKKPWKYPCSLYEAIEIPEIFRPFVNDYKMNLIDVPRLSQEQVSKYKGDFQIIADYFVQLHQSKNYNPSSKPIQHVDSMLKLMSVLTNDKRYTEWVHNKHNGQEVGNMCEVLDRIVAEGENRGEAKGEERGERKANLAAIRNIMKKFNITAQEAMETLDISKADFKMYMSLL